MKKDKKTNNDQQYRLGNTNPHKDRLIPKTIKLLFVASLVSTRSIKEKDQTLIGSESG
jgi:hypothetical protein